MNYLDIGFLLLIALYCLGGLIRGMGRSFSSLLVWVCAFVGGALLTGDFVGYIQNYVGDPPFAYLITFLLVFFSILFALGFINLILGLFLMGSHKGLANRIMGSFLGVIRAGLAAFLAVFIIAGVPGAKADWIAHSWTYQWLKPWAVTLQHKVNFPQPSSSKAGSTSSKSEPSLTSQAFMESER